MTTWGASHRPAIVAFERYFSWADTMRTHLEEQTPNYQDEPRAHWQPYMAYWYGGLYAVTEGWTDLGFRDNAIDSLITNDDMMALLRRYRNGAFHFQRDYFDRRFVDVWERDDVVEWARHLHHRFKKWILEELPKIVQSTFPEQKQGTP